MAIRAPQRSLSLAHINSLSIELETHKTIRLALAGAGRGVGLRQLGRPAVGPHFFDKTPLFFYKTNENDRPTRDSPLFAPKRDATCPGSNHFFPNTGCAYLFYPRPVAVHWILSAVIERTDSKTENNARARRKMCKQRIRVALLRPENVQSHGNASE